MSIILRPNGDEIANYLTTFYKLRYLDTNDISLLSVGDVVDVLCDDGFHYLAVVKKINMVVDVVKLHFIYWNQKFDYSGSLRNLYVAKKGSFSMRQGIGPQNTYIIDVLKEGEANLQYIEVKDNEQMNMEESRMILSLSSIERSKVQERKSKFPDGDRINNTSNASSFESCTIRIKRSYQTNDPVATTDTFESLNEQERSIEGSHPLLLKLPIKKLKEHSAMREKDVTNHLKSLLTSTTHASRVTEALRAIENADPQFKSKRLKQIHELLLSTKSLHDIIQELLQW